MGEIARGSWGVMPGLPTHILPAVNDGDEGARPGGDDAGERCKDL